MKVYTYESLKISLSSVMQVQIYAIMQMQIYKYITMKIWNCKCMQVWKYESKQVCKNILIRPSDTSYAKIWPDMAILCNVFVYCWQLMQSNCKMYSQIRTNLSNFWSIMAK